MMVILPVLLASCARHGPAPLAPVDAGRLRGEAILALQDYDGPPLLEEADVSAVAAGLRAIHAAFPEVRDVAGYGLPGTVTISLEDTLSRWISARVGVTAGEGSIERTGVAGLDSVSAMLGVESLSFIPQFDVLRARSPRAVNAPAAGRLYGRVPGVRYAGPLILIGEADGIRARMEGGASATSFHAGGETACRGAFPTTRGPSSTMCGRGARGRRGRAALRSPRRGPMGADAAER